MNGSGSPRTRMFVVITRKGHIKTTRIVSARQHATRDEFFDALVRARKELMVKFPSPQYRTVEGTASNVADFSWSFPELMKGEPCDDPVTVPHTP